MARIPRLTMTGEPAVYHVISRTALDGFVLGDVEKEYLLTLLQRLSAVYFTEVLGFCLMGNHFHLLVRMHPEATSDGFSSILLKGVLPAPRLDNRTCSQWARRLKTAGVGHKPSSSEKMGYVCLWLFR